MSKPLLIAVVIISLLSLAIPGRAWAGRETVSLAGIEFLFGYGQGDLDYGEDYKIIPLLVAFDFDIKALTKKIGFNPASMVQFQIEPFLGLITQPKTNLEIGNSFLFKLGLVPDDWKLQPYLKGGAGMIYMTQHTIEQSTQFNFIPQAGAGLHYFINSDTALTAEYRFRHLSNASIKHPNSGIDADIYLFGIARRF
ncbi:MAG: acyloxyacyl hydrolase [Candidatus Omnitrophica bacterium]|nr:acyloxyacyl hydrolase [Candidatus Omnitrophota bacterium]MBU1871701.1 acyloxyacyl hydrolase [Candidatus Omnitrophota bacterium]